MSMLYILIVHKDNIHSIHVKQIIEHEEKARIDHLLYKALTETTSV